MKTEKKSAENRYTCFHFDVKEEVKMSRKNNQAFFILLLFLVTAQRIYAATPQLLNYQGKLTQYRDIGSTKPAVHQIHLERMVQFRQREVLFRPLLIEQEVFRLINHRPFFEGPSGRTTRFYTAH